MNSLNPSFDINNCIEIDGKVISKDEYYFNRMDRTEPSKRDRLKVWIDSLCSQDLTMYHPDDRKAAIIGRIRFVDELQKEYNEKD